MLTPPVSDSDHQIGSKNSPVTLIEYGDFECPYCGEAYTNVEAVREKMGDQLRFVFRNFPLREMHRFAEDAAEASEAAAVDGKFWDMYHSLFQNQQHLSVEDIVQYGEKSGMNGQKLKENIENHTYKPKVDAEITSGEESDVQGTPTFFINGQIYQESYEEEDLLEALQAEIDDTRFY